MLYLLDADTLITSSNIYYKMKRWLPFWDWLKAMGEAGKIKIPFEQYQEIVAGMQEDDLVSWLKQEDIKMALLLDEEADPKYVALVTSIGYAHDLTEVEILKVGKDPFLISYALKNKQSRCVVSFEASAPSKQRANRKVPDVCKSLGVNCVNMFDVIEELDFKVK